MPRMETAANTTDWKTMSSPTKAAIAAPSAPRETKPANRLTVRTSTIANPSATAIQSRVTASPPTCRTHETEFWSCGKVGYVVLVDKPPSEGEGLLEGGAPGEEARCAAPGRRTASGGEGS